MKRCWMGRYVHLNHTGSPLRETHVRRKKPDPMNRDLCVLTYRAFFFGSAFFCAELFFLVGLFFLGSAVFFGI
jgi:hypothetical protein